MHNNCIIVKNKDVDLIESLISGQMFRFKPIKDGYIVYSLDKCCTVTKTNDGVKIESNDVDYFKVFFNLSNDNQAIYDGLTKNAKFSEFIPTNAPLLCIFKQNEWECLLSFIISANNNIPRIKGIIDKLCDKLGEVQPEGYKAFPNAKIMSEQNEELYKSIGLGYRAPYVLKTARMINDGFDLKAIYKYSTDEARKLLMTLPGVGPKVADCILLFGYNRFDVFPVDTWIKKVYKDIYKREANVEQMRKEFIADFGTYAGIAQQYLYYNKRENNIN